MENRVKRKSFATLLAEAAKPTSGDRARGLVELFRERFPELVQAAPKPGEFHGRKITQTWFDEDVEMRQHQLDALEYFNQAQVQSRMHRPAPTQKTLRDFDTTELIMELLGRGFAVQKVPERKP